MLELARQFSTKCLQKKLDEGVSEEIDDNMSSWIRHSLDLPLHWRSPELDARWFLDAYAKRPDASPLVFELAKLDFNIKQTTYQEELKDVSRYEIKKCLSRHIELFMHELNLLKCF